MIFMVFVRRKKSLLGENFSGKDTYEVVNVDASGKPVPVEKTIGMKLKAPAPGYKKPFDYELWNTLRRLGRVGKKAKTKRKVLSSL